MDFDLSAFPNINSWCDRLMHREAWQQTQPNAEQLEILKQTATALIEAERNK